MHARRTFAHVYRIVADSKRLVIVFYFGEVIEVLFGGCGRRCGKEGVSFVDGGEEGWVCQSVEMTAQIIMKITVIATIVVLMTRATGA